MKIYFSGSIAGGRQDTQIYFILIKYLKNYGEVLTEHVFRDNVDLKIENNENENLIHDRDFHWLLLSNVIVAEITKPSLGVGYEIGRAVEHKKPILCLYRLHNQKKPSAMIKGCPHLVYKEYDTLNTAEEIINVFFSSLDKL